MLIRLNSLNTILDPTSPTRRLLLCFSVLYLFLIIIFWNASSRDPGSSFFNPSTAYNWGYSKIRQGQALELIAKSLKSSPFQHQDPKPQPPDLCVGIASFAKDEEGAQYLRTTVGSLLHGLADSERARIYLVTLYANINPTVHPSYSEPWLGNLLDQALIYKNLSMPELQRLYALESDPDPRKKELNDYAFLMKACLATNSPYIAMLEDDVIAMDGWFHRTMDGLRVAREKTARMLRPADDFLYLRLFYTESTLGWKSTDTLPNIIYSLLTIALVAGTLTTLRTRSPILQQHLPNGSIAIISLFFTPLLLILFFAAGKATTLALPTGLSLMSQNGCCTQGLVFPRPKAEKLTRWYETVNTGYVDLVTEDYANESGELRWALTPSVLQHAGRLKMVPGGMERVWNFGFERFSAERLGRQHERVVGGVGGG